MSEDAIWLYLWGVGPNSSCWGFFFNDSKLFLVTMCSIYFQPVNSVSGNSNTICATIYTVPWQEHLGDSIMLAALLHYEEGLSDLKAAQFQQARIEVCDWEWACDCSQLVYCHGTSAVVFGLTLSIINASRCKISRGTLKRRLGTYILVSLIHASFVLKWEGVTWLRTGRHVSKIISLLLSISDFPLQIKLQGDVHFLLHFTASGCSGSQKRNNYIRLAGEFSLELQSILLAKWSGPLLIWNAQGWNRRLFNIFSIGPQENCITIHFNW